MELITALSHTLLHSLWQGAILAGIGGLTFVLTRNHTSQLRYKLLVILLFAFAVVAGITFAVELDFTGRSVANVTMGASQTSTAEHGATVTIKPPFQQFDVLKQLTNYLNANSVLIVLIWSIIVLIRIIQLVFGLRNLAHLRNSAIFGGNEEWAKRTTAIACKLGIQKAVRVAESGMARVPMVIGHMKPLILIPIGMLTALPPAEVEAILIHEMAHICRRDYLVNLLQSLLEIIFFFNPAVLWLSDLIRRERENCCDDIAIAETGDKLSYIRALVSCQEQLLLSPAYAMAFPGKRNELSGRVKRMISGGNQTLNIRERGILLAIMLVTALFAVSFSNPVDAEQMIAKDNRVKNAAGEKRMQPVNLPDTISVRPMANRTRPKPALSPKKQQTADKLYGLKQTLAPLDTDSISSNRVAPIAPLLAIRNQAQKIEPYKPEYKAYEPKTPTLGDIVGQELMRDGLISKTDAHLSFKLSTEELIINGKRQAPGIYRKYREKFVPATGDNSWTLYHNYDTNSTTDQ